MSSDKNESKYAKIVELAESIGLDVIILVGPNGEYNGALVGDADFVSWFQKKVGDVTEEGGTTEGSDDSGKSSPPSGTLH